MAITYPQSLSVSDTKSPAEVKVFNHLKKKLNDKFHVFHGRYLLRKDTKYPPDREADFVIMHPEYGFFVLEVKGGGVFVENGRWVSVDRNNNHHAISNPIDQARDCAYIIHNHLEADSRTKTFDYLFGYCAGFPDIPRVKDHTFGIDSAQEIEFYREDFEGDNLETVVLRMMLYWREKRSKLASSRAGFDALLSVIAPTLARPVLLNTEFGNEEEQFIQLTDAQYHVLEGRLQSETRHLITGCAGSGKTILATKLAIQLAQEGKEVLFVCFHERSERYLKQLLDPYNIEVFRYFELCREMIERGGYPRPRGYAESGLQGITKSDFYDGILPKRFYDAAHTVKNRYDAIIVDEGQDFRYSYWEPLFTLLRDPNKSIFYVFGDDNQRIYSLDSLPFKIPEYHLTQNFRNTRTIGELVGRYYRGVEKYQAVGPESNRAIQVVPMDGNQSSQAALKAQLNYLRNEGVSLKNIVILTPLLPLSMWKPGISIGNYTLSYDLSQTDDKSIRVSSIRGFKGLECPVVILTELGNLRAALEDRPVPFGDEQTLNVFTNHLLYVAISRAKNHLIVLGELPSPL